MSEANDPRSVIQRYTMAVLRKDWDTVGSLLSDDSVSHEPPSLPYGGEHRGRDAIVALCQTITSLWGVGDIKGMPWMVVEGDEHSAKVVTGAHFGATAHATGNEFEVRVAELYTIVDGKITEAVIHYWDTKTMCEALAG
ncbi:MAG TPA: nuclear transport factor 2 family protein [Mycobacteriales bacterium]|nr:nuclear transport factor 2 family protein [Mycobacteriales bacterium]